MEEHSRDHAEVNRALGLLKTDMRPSIRYFAAILMRFVVVAVAAQSPVPYASIAAIHSHPQSPTSEVTVHATLTLNGDPSYVQDSTGGAKVDGLSTRGLRIGDQLLVTGHADDAEEGLILRDSRVDLLWHGSPVPPLSVTPDEAAQGKFAALLVEVKGRFTGSEHSSSGTWLKMESGQQTFLAKLNFSPAASSLPNIPNGAIVSLRGVCSLQPSDTLYQGGFAVLLRSEQDVTVVSGPPWWSLKHLLEIGILLAVLVIAGHVTLVHMLTAKYNAIMAERARLGLELHDTLSQGFAGLSFQIQAAQKAAPRTNAALVRHLDVALDMVRHSHAEAHCSIMMLRPQQLASGADLPSAIRDALEQSTAGSKLQVHFAIQGSVTALPLVTTDALYRIAQEAIANALRHGTPSTLNVALEYEPSSVCLVVTDDGSGFDPRTSQASGYGLAGMRERVRALRGEFSIASEPGRGTRIRARIHLRGKLRRRLFAVLRNIVAVYWERR